MLGRGASNPSTITFSHCISGFFAAPSVHTSHLRSHLLHNLSSPSLNHSLLANPIYPKYKEQFRKASTQQPLLGKSSVSRNLYSTLENDCPRDNTFVDSTMTVEVSPGAPSTPKEISSKTRADTGPASVPSRRNHVRYRSLTSLSENRPSRRRLAANSSAI